tara:strand:+ start:2648 stop:3232 length:585 start_codon:yes stop_codon:yes gene_type:complete
VKVINSEIGCIVLAAGESSRLGHPKALIEVGGETLVSWVSRRLTELGLSPVIVTRNELYQKVKDSVGDVDVIVNYSPESGRTGTVKEGMKFLRVGSGGPSRILIVPVDRPGFSQSTVEFLMSKVSSTCPTFEGRGGHPLLVSEEDCNTILKVSSDVPLNKVIYPQRIPVEDRYLHLNVDTEEDVDRFLRAVEFL